MELHARVRTKTIKGARYYYADLTFRAEKLRTYSVYVGKTKPKEKQLKNARKKLIHNAASDLAQNFKTNYLSEEQVLVSEILRRRYKYKLGKLSNAQIEDVGKIEVSNFVYTTLITEGIPVTLDDAQRAASLSKKRKILKDLNLDISLSMTQGVEAIQNKKKLSISSIKSIHKIIMRDFEHAEPGQFRRRMVNILRLDTITGKGTRIRFRPAMPNEISRKINKFIEWYNKTQGIYPVEKAALAHLKFYVIHPFIDGNKRISRLLLNKALYDIDFPMLNISKNEEEYFNALIKSVENKNPKYFVDYVFSAFIEKCSRVRPTTAR